MCSIYTQLSIRGSKNINSLQIKGRWFPSFHCSICIPPLIFRGCVYFVRKMWTYDCFQGFYTNWRVSIENLIYAILVGNRNIFMCKWLLVYIAYFILYREYGQLGELFNMDPLPWLLQRLFFKFKSLKI